jgi:hypothetical protein
MPLIPKRLFINRKESHDTKKKRNHDSRVTHTTNKEPNPGDWWSCPRHYFDEFVDSDWIDITDVPSVDLSQFDQIIVGGGGLLGNDNFDPYIQQLLPHADRVWFWAPGINNNISDSKELTRSEFAKLVKNSRAKQYNLKGFDKDKIAVRDYNQSYNYLPCVTCMHPVFDDIESEIKQDYLILAHHKVKTLLVRHRFLSGKKRLLQPKTEIAKIVKEIKRSKYIVTNSYHGAYWSMLCNKPVVLISPWTNKFLFFKHQPTILTMSDLKLIELKRVAPETTKEDCYDFTTVETYPDYLDECRTANREFYFKVTAHE